jgi:hypothetical protein
MTSAAGATTAVLLWAAASRTRLRLGQGFENEGMDLTVLFTELPLVAAAGALVPALVYVLAARLLTRR